MTDTMKEIKEIRSQIGHLRLEMAGAERRLEEAGLRHLGLEIGDRIEVDDKGIVEVTGCNVLVGEPIPTGFKVKKDGAVGYQSAGFIGRKAWRKL